MPANQSRERATTGKGASPAGRYLSIAFDNGAFANGKPATLNDFFDLQRFPGPRGLRDSGPKYNLELALMADGIPSWQVYSVLTTRAGANRAFAKLDTIVRELLDTVISTRYFAIALEETRPSFHLGRIDSGKIDDKTATARMAESFGRLVAAWENA